MAAAPSSVVVLLRRLQARPGTADEGEVLGRCEGGALSTAFEVAARLELPVVAIAVGPARREDRVLAVALRAGCARAIRVDDSQLGDVDYLGVAQVLAAAIKHVGGKVVVCGDRSGDEGAGAIGPAVAELLEWTHLTGVGRVTVEGEHLIAVRHADTVFQRVRLSTPAVLCVVAPSLEAKPVAEAVADEEEEAPAAAATRRKRARTPVPSIDELDLADLGIDPRAVAPRRTTAGRLRQVRNRGTPTLATSAADLIARLRADRLLGES
jgi:electron transfer flavoprotein beta subunit